MWKWAIVLGVIGFAAGFFGPIALNPEANQGPLLGILIMGPGGFAAGLVGGAIVTAMGLTQQRRNGLLLAVSALLATTTLWFSLPHPALLGYVIDAEVQSCRRPIEAADAALGRWERAVANAPWVSPPASWKQTALANAAGDHGVVLTLRVARRSAIREHRRPWNRGELSADPWLSVDQPNNYYADDAGSTCDAYLLRKRDLYLPFSLPQENANAPNRVWPPTDTRAFLLLQELGPVPANYRAVLN